MFVMLELLLACLMLHFPGKHLFGVFLVEMTALCAMRTEEELTALTPVLIALPLERTCIMFASRESATSKF